MVSYLLPKSFVAKKGIRGQSVPNAVALLAFGKKIGLAVNIFDILSAVYIIIFLPR
jgi:hypothetical protein